VKAKHSKPAGVEVLAHACATTANVCMHPALQQGTMASTHTAPSRRVFILNKESIVEPCDDNYPFRLHFLLNNPLQFHYITIDNSFGKQVISNAGKAGWKISDFQEHSCVEVRAAVSVNKTTTRHGYSAYTPDQLAGVVVDLLKGYAQIKIICAEIVV